MRLAVSNTNAFLLAAALSALFVLAACSVKETPQNGNKNIDIQTLLGGIHVSTSVDAAKDVGLPVYPGARPKPHTAEDKNSANVNLSTAFFGLKVAVLDFLSDDPPAKIAAFYRTALRNYGTVLECHSGSHTGNVGPPTGPFGELHCDGPNVGDTLELKVGTQDRQHVVAIKPYAGGTEFSLVYVNAHSKGEAL